MTKKNDLEYHIAVDLQAFHGIPALASSESVGSENEIILKDSFDPTRLDVIFNGEPVGSVDRTMLNMYGYEERFSFPSRQVVGFVPWLKAAEELEAATEPEPESRSDLEMIGELAAMYFESRASFDLASDLCHALKSERFVDSDLRAHAEEVFAEFVGLIKEVISVVSPRNGEQLSLMLLLERLIERQAHQDCVERLATARRHLKMFIFDAAFELIESCVKGTSIEDDWIFSKNDLIASEASQMMASAVGDEKAKRLEQIAEDEERQRLRAMMDRDTEAEHKPKGKQTMYVNTRAFKGIFWFLMTAAVGMGFKIYEAACQCVETMTPFALCYRLNLATIIFVTLSILTLASAYLAGFFGLYPRRLFGVDHEQKES